MSASRRRVRQESKFGSPLPMRGVSAVLSRRQRVALLLASTCIVVGAGRHPAEAADFRFIPPSGAFATPGNWTPNDPANGFNPPPGPGDDAHFGALVPQSMDVTNATN